MEENHRRTIVWAPRHDMGVSEAGGDIELFVVDRPCVHHGLMGTGDRGLAGR
jgi:hypothetical protein